MSYLWLQLSMQLLVSRNLCGLMRRVAFKILLWENSCLRYTAAVHYCKSVTLRKVMNLSKKINKYKTSLIRKKINLPIPAI